MAAPDAAPSPAPRAWAGAALVALALVLTAAVLWPALGGELVYDDLLLVARNPVLQPGASLRDAFGRGHWSFAAPQAEESIGYWRPLTNLALLVGGRLGGGAPAGFHAVSIALHLASVAVVFLLARRLARSAWVGFWAALLFGLHPVQVEAVAWISAVNDPLWGLFCLLALLAFLRWREAGSRGAPLLAGLAFLLALVSKESAIATLPLVLALDLGRPPREGDPGGSPLRSLRPSVRAWLPFAAAAALWLGGRALVFDDPLAGLGRVTTDFAVTVGRQVSLRFELLGGFLRLLVWPAELALFREVRPVAPWSDVLLAGAWVAGWLVAVIWAWRARKRPALAALLVLVAGVSPVLVRLELLGRFPLSERYLYVAVLGPALLAPLVLARVAPRFLASALLALLAVAAGWWTRARIEVWRTEESLMRSAATLSPRSPYAQWGLGRVLLQEYRERREPALLEQAYQAFTRAQDLASPPGGGPAEADVFFTYEDVLQANLGVGWFFLLCALDLPQECSLDEAELVFRATLERYPRSEYAHIGLGVALMHRGALDESEQHLRRATELAPRLHEAWYNLGQVHLRRADWEAAVAAFERAVELVPGSADAWLHLAMARVEGFRPGADEAPARRALARARELLPDDPQPVVQLGALAAKQGRYADAVARFEEALRIDGDLAHAHLLRGKALAASGDVQRALGALYEAARLAPGDFEAHYLAGVLLHRAGAADEARPYLERALAIQPEGPYAAELRALLAQ